MTQNRASKSLATGLLLGLVCLSTGCAEGMFSSYGAYNPWVRKQWEEENQYAMSLRSHRDNLAAKAKKIDSTSPQELELFAGELASEIESDSSLLLKRDAVKTLARIQNDTAFQALCTATKNPSADIRRQACHSLGSHKRVESIACLQEVIGSDTDVQVRLSATRALENFRDPAAVQALALALDDPGPAIQFRAMESLKKVTGEDYSNNVEAWRAYVMGNPVIADKTPSIADRVQGVFR